MEKVIIKKIYTAILSAAVTFLAGFVMRKLWTLSTGDEPPNPQDPQIPTGKAVAWFLASGVGVGLAQLLFHRFMAKREELSARRPTEQ